MPRKLPNDEKFRVAHYLSRAEARGECLCIGDGSYYPTWWKMPGRTVERLSQLVCRSAYGPRPSRRAVVMHSCDNKACIKPEHLSWGTQKLNIADARAKGRMSPPPRPQISDGKYKWAKLTAGDIAAIRERAVAGERLADIAADFGISFQQVSRIKLGQRWGHVP